MITKEQIEAGCEIWLAFNGEVLFSRYNRVKTYAVIDVVNDPDYHPSKYEAELYLLECALNDN